MQPLPLDEPGDCARGGNGLARPRRVTRKNSYRRPVANRRMNLSAVVLAGGKSSRMGRDKARLEIGGQPSLARQIQLVKEIGAGEVFISGRAGKNYEEFGCRVLFDQFRDAGPLAGIERAVAEASLSRLL